MKVPLLPKARSPLTMPREVRRVVKELRELSTPRTEEALDLTRARRELRELIGSLTSRAGAAEIYEAIDGYVDTYVAEFLRSMHEKHIARLGRLDELEIVVEPHRARAETFSSDAKGKLRAMDKVVANALDHLSDPEGPITEPEIPET